MNYNFSVQRLAHLLIICFLVAYILIIGKTLLVPVAFAVFLTYMLYPVAKNLEAYMGRVPAILLAFLSILIPLIIVVLILGIQFSNIFQDLPSLSGVISEKLDISLAWIHQYLAFVPSSSAEIFENFPEDGSMQSVNFLQTSFTSSSTFFLGLVLTIVYSFLFLLYRGSLKNFILVQVPPNQRNKTREVIRRIQKVSQRYVNGLTLVVFILLCLNSLALWLIGIKYPIFWGGLAALLAVIPYLGTFVGGLFPFLFAIVTTDTLWQPSAIIIVFTCIQIVEGNFISPKVIGSSVGINPFFAIFSLILGGMMWGIAGMILALPIISVLRIIILQIDFLKPVGLLLSSKLHNREDEFMEEYDRERYRIRSFFSKNED